MTLWRRRNRTLSCVRCGVWVAPDREFFDADGWMICDPTCPGPSRWDPPSDTPIYDRLVAERSR